MSGAGVEFEVVRVDGKPGQDAVPGCVAKSE